MIVQNAVENGSGGWTPQMLLVGIVGVMLLWICRKQITRAASAAIAKGLTGLVKRLVGAAGTLWPLYAGVGAMLAVLVVRSASMAYWWPALLASLTGAGLVWWQVADLYRRIWMSVALAAAGAWAAVAIGSAELTGWGWLTGGLIGIVATIAQGIEQQMSGEGRIMQRLQADRWREMTESREMAGLKRGKITRSPMGLDVVVTLNGKLTVESLTSKIRHLETGLGTRRGAIRIEGHDMAHKATLRIMTRNPLKKNVPWAMPEGPVTIQEPARLSMDAYGEWTEVDLRQRILVVGSSGSGKSSVQRVLAAPVILAQDADLEVWDLKQGTESQHYEGKATLRITTAAECKARLAYLRTVEIPRRAALMQSLKTSTWPTSPTYRDLIVMVDEGAALIRELDADELEELFTFLEQARAYGIYLWWATQFPKSTNLPTELRSQMSCVIALKMRRSSESRVVFEELTKEGWTPHRLPGKGWLMILDDDHDSPQESRASFLDEKAFRRLTRVSQSLSGPAAVVPPRPVAPPRPAVPPMPALPPLIPAQPDPMDEAVSLAKRPAPATAAPVAAALPPVDLPDMLRRREPEPAELATPDAVAAALADAPAEGLSAAELQVATGRGKSQVYAALQELQDDGRAVRVSRGRYVLASTEAGEVTA